MIEYYIISIGAMLLCGVIAGAASAKVHSAYKKYGGIGTKSHMTGYDTARRLLKKGGVTDISVGRVHGHLSDHYHPTRKEVNLSESVYGSDSIAAVAVAAHEVGHVMQKKRWLFSVQIAHGACQSDKYRQYSCRAARVAGVNSRFCRCNNTKF